MKEHQDELDRQMKIVKAKRWEVFKEEQKRLKEEH